MIKSLGIQKIFMIALLCAVLALTYFYGNVNLGTKTQKLERELRVEQSNFNTTVQKLSDLKIGVEKFEVQKDKFTNLQALGFFDIQDRVSMARRLDEIGKESGLLSADYTINSIAEEENEKATEAGYKILVTPINFKLQAVLDKHIYEYIYLLNYSFPGHVTIKDLKIIKDKEITPKLLQNIGTGKPTSIVSATLNIRLRTLVENGEGKIFNTDGEGYQ